MPPERTCGYRQCGSNSQGCQCSIQAHPRCRFAAYAAKYAPADQPTLHGFLYRDIQVFLAESTAGHIDQGPQGCGHRVTRSGLNLLFSQRSEMENAPGRHSLAKAMGHGEMDAFRHDVTQVMDCERCLMGNDRLGKAFLVSAPEGPADQVLALAGREVAQAKDAAVDS